jgi:hypothetical protein
MSSNIPGYVSPGPFTGLTSGSIQSGQFSSGVVSPAARTLIADNFYSAEPISGGSIPVAVAATQVSGIQAFAQTAMASVSGRMPAFGIVTSNYLSGVQMIIYRDGPIFNNLFNYSGWLDQCIYVGMSGQLSASGAPQLSGNIQQIIGVSVQNSGMVLQIGDALEGVVAQSGDIGSGAITGSLFSGYQCIASGTIGINDLASGVTLPSSGSIQRFQLGSGAVNSGHIGSGAVLGRGLAGAFCIASGGIGRNDLASGLAQISGWNAPVSGVITTTGTWIQNTPACTLISSDVTNNTNTFAVVTGLTSDLVAGRKYAFKIVLFFSTDQVGEGVKFDLNGGSATATTFIASAQSQNVGGTSSFDYITSLSSVLANLPAAGALTLVVNGSIICNAAGTFRPEFAQVAHSTGTATIKAGSYMVMTDCV